MQALDATIGIAGPFTIPPFRNCLRADGSGLPLGLGGTPVVNLVEALLSRGRRVVVFTLDPAISSPRLLEGPQLKICVGPFRERGRARDFFAAERAWLRDAFWRERPAILHAHWTYEYAMAALETGLPTLITAHDAPWRGLWLMRDAYRAARTVMALRVSCRAQLLTAVSQHVGRHFRHWLRHAHDIEVIPNPVPLHAFRLGEQPRYFPASGRLTFATVLTGWSAVKNGKAALQAFRRVRRVFPEARLCMFGDGYGSHEEAEAWAQAAGCNAGVEFRGMVPYEDLLQELSRNADILLHPAREEAFGMAIAEAMALGIPVIGGRRSGAVPELLQDGRAGMLADVSSERVLAEAMLRLASDDRERRRLAAAARLRAQTHFRPEVVAASYERLYRKLAPLAPWRPLSVNHHAPASHSR